MNLNSLSKVNESRAQTGLHSALFVKLPSEDKYYLFMPGTKTPFLGGEYETVDIKILQSNTTGKLFGRMTIDDEEVEFMLHRDNVVRIESFVDKTLDFLSVTADGLGYKATGMVKYKPNDGEDGDPHTGTYTISATYVSKNAVRDIRPLIKDTVFFANAIPESRNLDVDDGTVNIESYDEGFKLEVAIKDNDGNTVDAFEAETTPAKDTVATGKTGSVKFKKKDGITGDNYACAYITISKTGFAPWTTTVLLESHTAAA